jgi:hypothetical protein
MIFSFILFNNKKENCTNYSLFDNWKPEKYEFRPLKNEWLYFLGICNNDFSIDYNKPCWNMICHKLDYITKRFVNECEKEYECNPRYIDREWVYEFEDGNDVINKIIDVSLEYFKERMYPLDKELCDMILPKVREKLFNIGRDYFSAQMNNQCVLNFASGIGRKRKNAERSQNSFRL